MAGTAGMAGAGGSAGGGGVGGMAGSGGEGRALQNKVITFELVNGEPPTEGDEISDQFRAEFGVSFALENGTLPKIAQVGEPATAFEPDDNPREGQGIGSFFLTEDGEVFNGLDASPLIVTFDTPTSAASGQILDIDFGEVFLVEARDADGNVLEETTVSDGDPGTGNRNAAVWSFERESADVYSIRLSGTRRRAGGFGLGFDNFNPTSPTIFGGDGTICNSWCDVLLGCSEADDEPSCLLECTQLLVVGTAESSECGEAFVDIVECVGGLSCEEFSLWIDAQTTAGQTGQLPSDPYPCRSQDVNAGSVCEF
jgi:hypothetical protein